MDHNPPEIEYNKLWPDDIELEINNIFKKMEQLSINEVIVSLEYDNPIVNCAAIRYLKKYKSHDNLLMLINQLSITITPVLIIEIVNALAEYEDRNTIEPISRLLNNESVEVRRIALQTLGNSGLPSAVPSIIASLNDNNTGIAVEAAHILGNISDTRCISALQSKLEHCDEILKSAVKKALNKINCTNELNQEDIQFNEKLQSTILNTYNELLKENDYDIKDLKEKKSEKTSNNDNIDFSKVDKLIAKPVTSYNNDENEESTDIINILHSKHPIKPAYDDYNPGYYLQEDAIKKRFSDNPENIIPSVSEIAFRSRIQDTKLDEPVINPDITNIIPPESIEISIITDTNDTINTETILEETEYTTLKSEEPYLEEIEMISSDETPADNEEEEDNLDELLTKFSPQEIVYLKILKDGTTQEKMSAIKRFNSDTADSLLEIIYEIMPEEYGIVQKQIIKTLCAINNEKSHDFIITLLKSEKWYIRGEAATAIGKIGSTKDFDALLLMLDDENKWVIESAIRALALIDLPKAARYVRNCLNNSNLNVQTAAKEVIKSFENQSSKL